MRNMINDGVNFDGVEHSRDAILSRMAVELEGAGPAGAQVWPDIRATASGIPAREYRAIILTGCGDSYYAALALRGLIESASGLPTFAQPAMEAVGFPSVLADERALLIGISVSGKVERTIQAVSEHRRRGGATVSISAHGDSDLAQAADAAIQTGLRGTPGPVPGTVNFVGSMLGLVAVAAELASRRGSEWLEDAAVVNALAAIAEMVMRDSHVAEREALALTPPFFSIGSGPDLGLAWFGVAKFIEAASTVGVAQDIEEWAHEQFFTTHPGSTVFVHATSPGIHARARRVAASVVKVGARLVTIAPEPLELADEQHWTLPPVVQPLRPLVAWVPMTMTALAYARVAQRHPFGIDLPNRMQTVDEDIYLARPARV